MELGSWSRQDRILNNKSRAEGSGCGSALCRSTTLFLIGTGSSRNCCGGEPLWG